MKVSKACQDKSNQCTLFQQLAVLSNMDAKKDSNLFSYLKVVRFQLLAISSTEAVPLLTSTQDATRSTPLYDAVMFEVLTY